VPGRRPTPGPARGRCCIPPGPRLCRSRSAGRPRGRAGQSGARADQSPTLPFRSARQEPPGRRGANSLAPQPSPGRNPTRAGNRAGCTINGRKFTQCDGARQCRVPAWPAGRTRSPPLPQAPVGDHGRAGGGSAISITRYGDEAYDFRDIRGPGLIRLESGRRLGWPQFLGAGMLFAECHQDYPPVRKSWGLCGVSVPSPWPRPPRPAGHPSALVRQRAGQSRTRMSGAACCEY
jgi:hypothetical protein